MTYRPTRRHFLKNAAVGAAVVGVASATPQVLSGSADASTLPPMDSAAPSRTVTAYVRDHRTGEIAVMVGEHQVIHHDRALAGRLARIAATAK
ncbi:MAG: twin-arginine translocation signal domain-containing protein [Nocardioidaceae bacterium]